MPRAKKGYKKKKKTKSVSWYDRKYTPKELAYKAWKGVKYITSLINVEKHMYDASNTSSPNNADGVILPVYYIPQGDGIGSRQGNSILAQSIYCGFKATINASATNTLLRCVILRDTQQIADTDPVLGNIIDTTFTNSALACLNENTVGRFQILFDKVYTLSADGKDVVFDRIFVKDIHHVRYNGSANTDYQKGQYYVCFWSDEATYAPSVMWNFRARYTDN